MKKCEDVNSKIRDNLGVSFRVIDGPFPLTVDWFPFDLPKFCDIHDELDEKLIVVQGKGNIAANITIIISSDGNL